MTDVMFAVCVQNRDYPASPELRKIYQVLPDAQATEQGLIRVIDESREDYLYPNDYFMTVELSKPVKAVLLQAA